MLVKLGVKEQATAPGARSPHRTSPMCIYNKKNLIPFWVIRQGMLYVKQEGELFCITATVSGLGPYTLKIKMWIYWNAARGGVTRMIRGLENWNYEGMGFV